MDRRTPILLKSCLTILGYSSLNIYSKQQKKKKKKINYIPYFYSNWLSNF